RRVLVEGNIFEYNWDSSQSGKAIVFTPRNQGGNCTWCTVEDITFDKNVLRHSPSGFNIAGTDDGHNQGAWSQQTARISIHDNLVYDIDAQEWGGCCNRGFLLLNVHSPNASMPGGIKDL